MSSGVHGFPLWQSQTCHEICIAKPTKSSLHWHGFTMLVPSPRLYTALLHCTLQFHLPLQLYGLGAFTLEKLHFYSVVALCFSAKVNSITSLVHVVPRPVGSARQFLAKSCYHDSKRSLMFLFCGFGNFLKTHAKRFVGNSGTNFVCFA